MLNTYRNCVMKRKKTVEPQKLNKKYFLGLPTGVYLISNCCEMVGPNTYTPAFHEYVASPEEREAQWKTIKAAHVNHRLCTIYPSLQEYKDYLVANTKEWGKSPKFVIIETEKKL